MLVINKIIKNIYNNLNIGIFFILSIPAQILILNNYDVISYHDLLVCFKYNCKKYNAWFESFEQNDVDEFLILFLEIMNCFSSFSKTF